MLNSQRFILDSNKNVIDALSRDNIRYPGFFSNEPESNDRMRDCVLRCRLKEKLEKLINAKTVTKRERINDEQICGPICATLMAIIQASHLDAITAEASVAPPPSDIPLHKAYGIAKYSSLSLFADDVEFLLVDIFGDTHKPAINQLRIALLKVVEMILEHLCFDLWQEHRYAAAVDWYFSAKPIYAGEGQVMCLEGESHLKLLDQRARLVSANPDKFCNYTVEFAKTLRRNCGDLFEPIGVDLSDDIPFE